MKIQHILVTTDLSETSRVAYAHAAGIAHAFGSRITLLHVDDLGESEVLRWGRDEIKDYVDDVLELRVKLLERARQELSNFGVTVNARMIGGNPAKEILSFASENDVDLIVLAKHGLGGFKRLLLGSVSEKVIRKAKLPVLLIDAEKPAASAPISYKNILTTTDFSGDSERGLKATLEFARAFDAPVKVLNVVKVPLPLVTIPGDAPVTWPPTHLAFLREHYEKRLEALIRELGDARLSYHVESSNAVPDTIAEAAESLDSDLITMPSHGKGAVLSALVGSTTMRVLKLTTRPVLMMGPRFLEAAQGESGGDAGGDAS